MGRTDSHREPESSGTTTGETLQVGPDRPPLWQRVPDRWRQTAVVLLALALGMLLGAVVTHTWREDPAPAPREPHEPVRTHEHDVELVVLGAVLPERVTPERATRPLRLRAAVLLSGNEPSEVVDIDSLDGSLVVSVEGLPFTVSPSDRLHAVALEVVPRDCAAARRWPPDARPFAVTWQDQDGVEHTDRAGDHQPAAARAVRRYAKAACAGS